MTAATRYDCNSKTDIHCNQAVWPIKSRQMSKKVAQKWFHKKMKDFDTFTKMPHKGHLGKIIVATGFKKLPKVQQIAQCGQTDCNWRQYNSNKSIRLLLNWSELNLIQWWCWNDENKRNTEKGQGLAYFLKNITSLE